MRFIFAAGILSALAFSCQRTDLPAGETDKLEYNETAGKKIRLSCELLDGEADGLTKSSHDVSALRKISNVNYYLFQNGSLVGQAYFEDAEDFALSLPSYVEKYNLYLLANVGRKTVRSDVSEPEMGTEIHHDYMSSENYFSTIESCGFPMSLVVKDFSVTEVTELQLRRLVHTLYVKADTEGLNSTEMNFTGLAVRNAARDVYPFAAESRARHFMDGDAANMDSADIEALNRGEEVTLYLLENIRGDVFPGNTDWKKRVPANMIPESERDCSSYIELTASAQTATAYYETNIYRAYIGASASDCNARRHACSTLNNRFMNDMIVDEEWRIDGDVPVVNETLAFIDNYELMGADMKQLWTVFVMPGFTTVLYIYRSNPDIEYDFTGPEASGDCRIKYTVDDVNPNVRRISLTTDLEWDELPETASGLFRLTSEDGLISKTLQVVVRSTSLDLSFRTEIVDDRPYMCLALEEPLLDMVFEAKIEGRLEGYLSHYPKGYKRKETVRTISKDFSYKNPGETMCESTMMFKAWQLEWGKLFNIGEMIQTYIWQETGWDSLNKYNGSDGYNKHAHPTSIFLNVDLSCSWKSRTPTENENNFIIYPTEDSADIPLKISNEQLSWATHTIGDQQTVLYAGGGVDFGIKWIQHDMEGDDGYVIYFDDPLGGIGHVINVTVNGIRSWDDNLPYVTITK